MRLSVLAVTCVLALADGVARSADAVEVPLVEQQSSIYNNSTTTKLTNNTIERQNFVLSRSFLYFHGSITNETMHQGGQFSIVIGRQEQPDFIIVRVHASNGLLGDGELSGELSRDGRFFASGQLLMGSNAFTCDLTGLIEGNKLSGSAKFVHNDNGNTAYGTFSLVKF